MNCIQSILFFLHIFLWFLLILFFQSPFLLKFIVIVSWVILLAIFKTHIRLFSLLIRTIILWNSFSHRMIVRGLACINYFFFVFNFFQYHWFLNFLNFLDVDWNFFFFNFFDKDWLSFTICFLIQLLYLRQDFFGLRNIEKRHNLLNQTFYSINLRHSSLRACEAHVFKIRQSALKTVINGFNLFTVCG